MMIPQSTLHTLGILVLCSLLTSTKVVAEIQEACLVEIEKPLGKVQETGKRGAGEEWRESESRVLRRVPTAKSR